MSHTLFALTVVLAWFAASNLAVSLIAAGLARFVSPLLIAERPDRAAWMLLSLRIAPAAVSLFLTLGVLIPAQWRWEPSGAEESAGYSILLLAAGGAAILALSAGCALRDTLAASGIARRWRSAARASGRGVSGLPVFVLADRAPVMSLVGIFKPTVFVADEVASQLTPEELEVSLAHEAAHARAGDNLKRLVTAWCPDLLGIGPLGRDLAARWRAATEFAADARAVTGSDQRAVALASALVKVARLVTPGVSPVPLAFSRIHHQALLAARIERLLHPAARLRASSRRPWALLVAAAAVLACAVVATHHPSLTVHQATEGLIRVLP